MAGSGAHLTGTLSTTTRPSVFELVSQENFGYALRPAVQHIIKTLAERNPAGIVPFFYRHFDELYLAFDTFVQWHYILTRGATLSEAFYGLERKLNSSDNKLFRIRLSYAVSVLAPYFWKKLDQIYSKYENENLERNSGRDIQPIVHISIFPKMLTLYPFIKTTISAINFCYLLAFVFGYSDYHNLIFRLLNMKLSYSSSERLRFVEEKAAEIFQPKSWQNPKRIPILLLRALGESVMFSVEIGSFFIQFLDWWYNDTSKERIQLTALPIPPAPQDTNSIPPVDKNKCPLCRQQFKNPTALSTSGIVFCYGCITPYLKQEQRCPVTALRSNVNHLIRIF